MIIRKVQDIYQLDTAATDAISALHGTVNVRNFILATLGLYRQGTAITEQWV